MRRLILCSLVASTGCFEDQLLPSGESDTDGESTGTATSTTATGSATVDPGTSASTSATTTSPTTTSATTTTTTESTSTTDEPTSTTNEMTTDSSPTDTGPGQCAADEVCIETPAGWAGPVYVATGPSAGSLPSCPADAEGIPGGGVAIDTPPFDCDCECPGDGDAECTFQFQFDSAPDCGGDVLGLGPPIDPGDCQSYGLGDATGVYVFQSAVNNIQCSEPYYVPPSPPFFQDRLDACAPAVAAACDGGTCLRPADAPFDGRACVYQDGEHRCPDPFGEQFVVYDGIVDTRECPCSCSALDADCGGTVIGFSDDACAAQDNEETFVGFGCVGTNGHFDSASVINPFAMVTCSPVVNAPPETGEVSGTNPRTYCCTSL